MSDGAGGGASAALFGSSPATTPHSARPGTPDGGSIRRRAALEQQFGRFAGKPVVLFRVGAGGDAAALAWMRLLDSRSRIVAMEVEPRPSSRDGGQIRVRRAGEVHPVSLAAVIAEMGAPDIVVDDGSRPTADVIELFRFLYPRVAGRGLYLVEDVRTSYAADLGGGLRKPTSFVELAKRLVDELNFTLTSGEMPATQFSRQTASILFIENAVLFERG